MRTPARFSGQLDTIRQLQRQNKAHIKDKPLQANRQCRNCRYSRTHSKTIKFLDMKKRKEIIDFLMKAFVIEINNKNIQEIEIKYKEAKNFVIREMIFQSIFTGIVFNNLKFITSIIGEYGNILYSILFITITSLIVVLILLSAIKIYALLKYKSKIKKYYHNDNNLKDI